MYTEEQLNNESICFEDQPRSTLGFVCLPTDLMADREVSAALSQIDGVRWRLQRLQMDGDMVNTKSYQSARDNLFTAADTIRPTNSVSVIALACTSLTFTLGVDVVNEKLKQAHPEAKVTNMASSVVEALEFIGAKRLVVLTPYLDELALLNNTMLTQAGFEIDQNVNLGLSTDEEISSVSQEFIRESVRQLIDRSEDVDTILVACSAFSMLTPRFIDELEMEFGKPVITSMQALLWNMLRISEIDDPIYGLGSLLRAPKLVSSLNFVEFQQAELSADDDVPFNVVFPSHIGDLGVIPAA